MRQVQFSTVATDSTQLSFIYPACEECMPKAQINSGPRLTSHAVHPSRLRSTQRINLLPNGYVRFDVEVTEDLEFLVRTKYA